MAHLAERGATGPAFTVGFCFGGSRHTYPGAPHSFFDRAYAEWGEACADAWRRILEFTGRHGASGEPV
ncbi:hypothetical protein [Microtetraspora niveoalba]|uniref:hypothetical protein n=1 Tax=Microtetraspora niveoalba TaxID=46175 RepID=UPI00082B09C2|nr:hypothetical protein [Microtetraspora niveoalba]